MAYQWIPGEIKDNAKDGNWLHGDSLGAVADIFAVVGNCRFLPYFPPTMAGEWFEIWKLLTERRVGNKDWPFLPPRSNYQTSARPFGISGPWLSGIAIGHVVATSEFAPVPPTRILMCV